MAEGTWPREAPRTTESHAEHKVYQANRETLPEGWTAWHSLRIRTAEGYEGEGDFVIAVPERRYLVLEVKGGRVEMRDGRWFQNGHPLETAPREQAHGYARTLRARLKELGCLSARPFPEENLPELFEDRPDSKQPHWHFGFFTTTEAVQRLFTF